jgi:hypothetical protein
VKNRLAKNSIALGLTTLIVTAGLSFSANGAPGDPVAQATASAVKGTGSLFNPLLDGGQCAAVFPTGTPTGTCGNGLDTPGIDAYGQNASATAAGVSHADATVAPINVLPLGPALDLTDIIAGLSVSTTSSILTPVLQNLGLLLAQLTPILAPIDDILQTALSGIDAALPITLTTGTVGAICDATPGAATGSSTVAPLKLTIGTGATAVNVPITISTTPNSDLIVGSDEAAQQIVDDVLDGLEATLNTSLGGSLDALAILFPTIKSAVVDALLDALEPALLTPIGNAIKPLLNGQVNVQTPVSPTNGTISVTALRLQLLTDNVLELGHVTCGPNNGPTVTTPTPTKDGDKKDDDKKDDDKKDDDKKDDDKKDDDKDSDSVSDSDDQADADTVTALPSAGAPNLLPFVLLGLGLLLFGSGVLLNEKRRMRLQ